MDNASVDLIDFRSAARQAAVSHPIALQALNIGTSIARDVAVKAGRPECLALASAVSRAVALNRGVARSRRIRLVCYILDQTQAYADDAGLSEKFSKLLGAAIKSARRGGVVTGQAGYISGIFRFHLRYTHHRTLDLVASTADQRIVEMWSWRLGADRSG